MSRLSEPLSFDFNWSDRFEADYTPGHLTAMQATGRLLASPPAWVNALMRLRNCIVRLFGLKPVDMAAGEAVGGFPVVSATDARVVLGFDDRHLDFRIVVDVRDATAGQIVGVTTLVRRKNIFGYIYIFFVGPFHRMIVPTTLSGFCTGIRPVDIADQKTRVTA